MKKYLVLSVILAAGMAAYPQTTRSAEETLALTARVESQAFERIEIDATSYIVQENVTIQLAGQSPFGYDDLAMFRRPGDVRYEYDDYSNWYDSRVIRYASRYPRYRPIPVDYRSEHYVYRKPVQNDLSWTPELINRFISYYPVKNLRDIDYSREIETITAYDAKTHVGTVKRVYGKVDEVYYSREDFNYIIYIGAPFPYQDISIVIPRDVARQLARSPKRYFKNQHIWGIGLIELWDEKPEIVIRDKEQVRKY